MNSRFSDHYQPLQREENNGYEEKSESKKTREEKSSREEKKEVTITSCFQE